MNPFPSFRWCAFVAESSGTAPLLEGGVVEQAYKAAVIAPLDIDLVVVILEAL